MTREEDDRRMIEEILRLLCQSQEGGQPEASSGLTAAFVQFMNEMPGGFLIYCADKREKIL